MDAKRSIFRLYILGHLAQVAQQPLVTLAEFESSRAIERVQLSQKQIDSLKRTLQDLRGFIEAGYPPFERASLEQLGSEMFDLIIAGRVRRLLDRATGSQHQVLPFEIYVEDNEIAGWPWEYLYDSSSRVFMCQEFHPISRGIFTLQSGKSLPPKSGKIHILLLLGVLPGDRNTTPQEEIKWIHEVFRQGLDSKSVEIKVMQAIRPDDLRIELSASAEYDIVHFFGHARYDEAAKEGYLRFERPEAEPFLFYANDFAQLLASEGKNIRLVFLNACETGVAQSADPARSSVAAAVLDRGIPAVIATQYSIPDTSAHHLSAMLYNALVKGKPLVEAMRDGRQSMSYAAGRRFFDWGIPVLYSSDPGLVIFPGATDTIVYRGLDAEAAKGASANAAQRSRARVRVALVDFDAKAGFLPDVIQQANQVQSYYHFQIAYLPLPGGVIRTDFENGKAAPQLFVPRLEGYLKDAPQDLQVDKVCCLTRSLIALDEEDYNFFTNTLPGNENIFFVTSFGIRDYARQANVTFAKAMLYLCLAQLVQTDERWGIDCHDETVGCLFDYCENWDDLVVSLKHMRLDHAECRDKIKDEHQLSAIDALLALDIPDKPSNSR